MLFSKYIVFILGHVLLYSFLHMLTQLILLTALQHELQCYSHFTEEGVQLERWIAEKQSNWLRIIKLQKINLNPGHLLGNPWFWLQGII